MVFSEQKEDDMITYLKDMANKIKNREIPDEECGFPKEMSKELKEYGISKIRNGKLCKVGVPPVVEASRYSMKYLGMKFGKNSKPKWTFVKSPPPGYPKTKYVAFDTKYPEGFILDYDEILRHMLNMKLDGIFSAAGLKPLPDFNVTTKSFKEWQGGK